METRRKFIKQAGAFGLFLPIYEVLRPLAYAQDVIYVKKKAAAGGSNPVTDDFNRANADPAGGNWTTLGTWGSLAISSNKLIPSTYGANSAAYYNAATPNATQYTQCISTWDVTGGYLGPAVRCQAGARTCYALVPPNLITLRVLKFVAGSFTELANLDATLVSGVSVIKLSVSGVGATVTLEGFVNGSSVGTTTDTAGDRIVAAGSLGVFIDSGAVTGDTIDDWEGGWT